MKPLSGATAQQWTHGLTGEFCSPLPDPKFGYRLHFADLAVNKALAAANLMVVADFVASGCRARTSCRITGWPVRSGQGSGLQSVFPGQEHFAKPAICEKPNLTRSVSSLSRSRCGTTWRMSSTASSRRGWSSGTSSRVAAGGLRWTMPANRSSAVNSRPVETGKRPGRAVRCPHLLAWTAR